MENLRERIVRALIEGRIIKSTIGKAIRYPIHFIDGLIGDIFINLYMASIPVNDRKILFKSFQGEYTCNPKYICEHVMKRYKDYEIVWVHNSEQNGEKSDATFPAGVRVVENETLSFYRELASSKYIIINSYLARFRKVKVHLKKNQVLVETWHGSLGIKRLIRVNEDKFWLSAMRHTAKMTKYAISNSKFETMVYKDTFWKDSQIVELGHPRNDILFRVEEHALIKRKVYEKYGIPLDKKLILYAPTYRIPCNIENYDIDIPSVIKELEKKWGGDWVFGVRFHPTIRQYSDNILHNCANNIVDLTYYVDMQEILIAADAAMSDYSSWMFDYILLGRPCFIFARDIERYKKTRGLYYPLEETPFDIAKSNAELCSNIESFSQEKYNQKIQDFLQGKGCVERGNASDLICRILKL